MNPFFGKIKYFCTPITLFELSASKNQIYKPISKTGHSYAQLQLQNKVKD